MRIRPLHMAVAICVSSFAINAQAVTVDLVAKLTASDGAAQDGFGFSVAIDGNTVVVGAREDEDIGAHSGSAYLFDTNGQQTAKLTASDGASYDRFGHSVAIDGNTVVVGSIFDNDNGTSSGSAYLFNTNGQQTAKLTASDSAAQDLFGFSVAIDGNTVVVGARGDDDNGAHSGSAYLFDTNGQQTAKLTASDGAAGDRFGHSVAIDGNTVVVGSTFDDDNATNSGSAYLFDTNGQQTAKLTASDGAALDLFGRSVAVSGDTIVVGSSWDDDNGASYGSAYVFAGAGYTQTKLTGSDSMAGDLFGGVEASGIAVSNSYTLVGAWGHDAEGSNAGAAYLFDNFTGLQLAKIILSDLGVDDYFGRSVGLTDDHLVIGAFGDDGLGSNAGAAYLYSITADTPPTPTPAPPALFLMLVGLLCMFVGRRFNRT
jgi:hypothetical protein